MKNLLSILLLFITSFAVGQDFVSGTKYLYNQGRSYSVVELNVISVNGDTTFIQYGNLAYSYINDQLYLEDTVLFFDFGSSEGDTLVYNNRGFGTKIRVDSIRSIALQNGVVYKHYFAHNTIEKTPYVIIKGLGEKKSGLDLFYLIGIPENYSVISVCRNDSLIYWLGTSPSTCNYDSLLNLGTINEKTYLPYKIYPNPAHDVLYLEGVEQADIRILDVLGAELYNGVYENSLDVSKLSSGVYFLEFMKNKTMYRTKFYKE